MDFKLVVVIWLATCALCDARTGEVPNVLTLPFLAFGAMVALWRGWGSVAIFAFTLSVLGVFYSLGGIGGADVKILAAVGGLWPESLLVILFGLVLWAAVRKLLGRRGSFRAVVPILIGAVVAWCNSYMFGGRL
jgi:Flp pilus assembly protein protease CpaA